VPIVPAKPGNPPGDIYDSSIDDSRNLEEYRPMATFSISKIYTIATLPAASANIGSIFWVIDATPGAKLQYSNGVIWIPLQY
jgi:hypothetical protein